ncbi:MAG TPA: hypothetical protein VEY30_03075, partial [Myxococcaceae bacterium]|nr:hypothetical protein [Myxococcaceae bacterium]
MSQRSPSPAAGLTLAGTPDRVRLRELQELLEEKRDAVAALDLELEILRHTLSDFEARYRWALAEEHATLLRVQAVVRHLERWEELLRDARGEDWGARSRGFESHRARDFRRAESARRQAGPAPKRAEAPAPEDASYAQERAARLKSVYRALARRYHPDLASTEEEQAAM